MTKLWNSQTIRELFTNNFQKRIWSIIIFSIMGGVYIKKYRAGWSPLSPTLVAPPVGLTTDSVIQR
jgi:hypothetical protein